MNYTLITGAASGIGEALAWSCAEEGFNLILLGRNQDMLDSLKNSINKEHTLSIQTLSIDLLTPGAAEFVYKQCLKNDWTVRILINNAALAQWGNFEHLSFEEMQEIIQLNQQTLVGLCHYFVPMLREVPYAHILNVASTAAFQPVPYFSVYAATKSFVFSFSRSLRYELREQKINVSCLCPGPTDTSFFEKVGYDSIQRSRGAIMKPKEVADAAVAGLINNKAVIVPGFSNRLGAFFSRHFPDSWMTGLIGKFFQPD